LFFSGVGIESIDSLLLIEDFYILLLNKELFYKLIIEHALCTTIFDGLIFSQY